MVISLSTVVKLPSLFFHFFIFFNVLLPPGLLPADVLTFGKRGEHRGPMGVVHFLLV